MSRNRLIMLISLYQNNPNCCYQGNNIQDYQKKIELEVFLKFNACLRCFRFYVAIFATSCRKNKNWCALCHGRLYLNYSFISRFGVDIPILVGRGYENDQSSNSAQHVSQRLAMPLEPWAEGQSPPSPRFWPYYTGATDKLLCLKNAGAQISLFFTSNE